MPRIQTCVNLKIRYNSFALTPLTSGCSSGPGSVFKANVAPRDGGSCPSAFTFSFNVWQSNKNNPCASSDKVVIGTQYGNDQLKFTDPANGDLHLLAGSPAIDAGDPNDYPSTDIDGNSRPRGSGPDAGAHEFGSAGRAVTAFGPGSGSVGSTVTLSGSGFTGATVVSLCMVPAVFSVSSDSQASAQVPAGACDGGRWRLTTGAGTGVSAGSFAVTSPTLSAVSPGSGAAGTTVTLSGTHLSGATQVSLCLIGSASFTVNSDTSITAQIPAGACNGFWRVTTAAGTAVSPSPFTLSPSATTISGVSPSSGAIGATVTLTGSGFSGATAVSLCYVPATFTVVDSATIKAQVPAGACDGRWRVTTPAGTGAALSAFTVTSPVAISSVSLTGAAVGASVVLTGHTFTGATQVTHCFVPATSFSVVNDTTINAVVPANACNGF